MKTKLFVVLTKNINDIWFKDFKGYFHDIDIVDINKNYIYTKEEALEFKKLLESEIGNQFDFEIKQLNISL